MSDCTASRPDSKSPEPSTNYQQWLAPIEPHDALPFERLASEYNFLNISSYGRVLTNLVIEELHIRGSGCRVLDVGCGCGIGRDVGYQWAIRQQAEELWGIEPDDAIQPSRGLFDHFQHALMETAELPASSFDVAYSSMVMEHVAEPQKFLAALHRCLKPGGVYLFATPNARSLVPWATQIFHTFGIDEIVLRLLRGQQQVEEYHYPVQFRCNTPRQLNSLASASGFARPQYAFIEGTGSYSYFRGPLRLLRVPMQMKRRWIRRPDRLATLICKMCRPEG